VPRRFGSVVTRRDRVHAQPRQRLVSTWRQPEAPGSGLFGLFGQPGRAGLRRAPDLPM